MVALCNRTHHHIFALWFLSSSFFLSFSQPNLSGRRLDVYHISAHGVDLVRISNACLKRTAHSSLKIQDAKMTQKSSSGHHRTTLLSYIFATKARIDNRKKNLLSSNMPSTWPHNMVNFGPLAAEVDPVVWGTPANFNGFRVLALQRYCTASSSGRQPNFAALNRGRHLCSARRPSRWALAHISGCRFNGCFVACRPIVT